MAAVTDFTCQAEKEQVVPSQDVIKIGVILGKGYVWNAHDAHKLRRDHRIVGSTIGCLPRKPNQNAFLGLPLQLMPEEFSLLLEKAIVAIADTSHLNKQPPEGAKEQLEKLQDDLYNQQVLEYKEKRKAVIMSMADDIIEGKKKKMLQKVLGKPGPKTRKRRKTKETESNMGGELLPEFDRESIIRDELERIHDLPKDSCPVQLFTRCPWTPKSYNCSTNPRWTFPSNEKENLRYSVYKDLWEKGYYLTNGCKFGGDFLAYPGDPLRYHAFFVVVCVPYTKPLRALDLVVLGRLGTQVKKTILLVTVKPDGLTDYISLKWSGD